MKRMSVLTVLALTALMGLVGATASATSLLLDGVWIRLVARGNGYSVDDADDTIRKRGVFTAKCYMRVLFENDGSSDLFRGRIVCENGGPGAWEEVGYITYYDVASDGGLKEDDCCSSDTRFTNRKGQFIAGYGSHFLLPVFSKKGDLKQVIMRSWGEIIGGSSLEPGISTFWGGYMLSGVSVPETSVPPEVVAALP